MKLSEIVKQYAKAPCTASKHTPQQIKEAVRLLLSEPGRLLCYLHLYEQGWEEGGIARALIVNGHRKFVSNYGGQFDRTAGRAHSEASFQCRNAADRLAGFHATSYEICKELLAQGEANWDAEYTIAAGEKFLEQFERRATELPVLEPATARVTGRWFRRFRKTDRPAIMQAKLLAAALGADGVIQVLIPGEQIGAKRPWHVWQPAFRA